jgi:hypothetical protein
MVKQQRKHTQVFKTPGRYKLPLTAWTKVRNLFSRCSRELKPRVKPCLSESLVRPPAGRVDGPSSCFVLTCSFQGLCLCPTASSSKDTSHLIGWGPTMKPHFIPRCSKVRGLRTST